MTTKSITTIPSQISALPLIIFDDDYGNLTMSIVIEFEGEESVLNLSEVYAKKLLEYMKENEWILYDFK